MRRHRAFWIILLITFAVSVGNKLSEHQDYPFQLRIRWEGYDTARYAVVHADTLLPITINSNGFLAIKHHYKAPKVQYVIHAQGDTVVVVNKALLNDAIGQLQFVGVHGISSGVDHLTLKITPRAAKPFRPQLRDVKFLFERQHGLSGQPVLVPDTVWLFGSPKSLAKIDGLHTLPATLEALSDTLICTLPLDPVWQAYPDLRVSTPEVRILIPVERFSEKTISVPVRFLTHDEHIRTRLYPDRVDVTFWVSEQNYDRLLPDMVQAVVEYDAADAQPTLPVRITTFPTFAHIKSVTPSQLKYVVIQ